MNNVNHGFLSNLFIIITANNYSRSMYKAVYTYISDQTKQRSSWRLAVAPTTNTNKQVSRISLIREWNWNSLKMAWQARTNNSSNSFKVYFTPTSNKMARTHPINITYIIQHRNDKFKSKQRAAHNEKIRIHLKGLVTTSTPSITSSHCSRCIFPADHNCA